MYYLWVLAFIGAMIFSWFLTLFGLPGNWLILGVASLFAYLVPNMGGRGISWNVVAVLAGLALLGELLEFAAGAAGMAKGGSKRGAVLAVIGSMIGGIAGAVVGIPIPLLGSLVGVLLFASLGAMAGAIAGERWKGSALGNSLEIGKAAFWGRLFGSLAKVIVGSVMIAVAGAAAFLP